MISTSSDAYIKNLAATRRLDPSLLELLKYDIDRHIFHYGAHFSHPYETENSAQDHSLVFSETVTKLTSYLRELERQPHWPHDFIGGYQTDKLIFSSAYVSNDPSLWSESLRRAGLCTAPPPWMNATSRSDSETILRGCLSLIPGLFRLGLNHLLSDEMLELLRIGRSLLDRLYSHTAVAGLLLPYTFPFFESSSLRHLRELQKPTVLCLHGIPGSYRWRSGNFPVDYIAVWGPAIRDNYIAEGFPADRIILTGHPTSEVARSSRQPRFDTEKVVVLTRPITGAPARNLPLVQNRSTTLDYINRVQIALEKVGVRSAVLRPHPSESPQWYYRHITSFYQIDTGPISQLLQSATLFIGGPSTILLDALMHGINYLTFEPRDLTAGTYFQDVAPPFNGSNPCFPCAFTDEELLALLRNRSICNKEGLEPYVGKSFNLESLVQVLAKPVPRPCDWR